MPGPERPLTGRQQAYLLLFDAELRCYAAGDYDRAVKIGHWRAEALEQIRREAGTHLRPRATGRGAGNKRGDVFARAVLERLVEGPCYEEHHRDPATGQAVA